MEAYANVKATSLRACSRRGAGCIGNEDTLRCCRRRFTLCTLPLRADGGQSLATVVTASAAAVYAAVLPPHTLHAAVARCRHAAPVATAAAAPVATVFAATSLQTRLIPHDLPEDSERKYRLLFYPRQVGGKVNLRLSPRYPSPPVRAHPEPARTAVLRGHPAAGC